MLPQSSSDQRHLKFEYVLEWDNDFLALFPHRGDFLWATHPAPGDRPRWLTESRYFLSDRLIQQGAKLYGVRFGAFTAYVMLDLDPTSAYHPWRDPNAYQQMLAALEPLGLVTCIPVQSSDRGGIHLYFPFDQPQKSWAIAQAVKVLLENHGFKLKPGLLELFPNAKPYSSTPTLYHGHRLPLQRGSYLLNEEWSPIYTTQTAFVHQWRFAQGRNDVTAEGIDRVLKTQKRKSYKTIRTSARKFLNDLDAEIEPGWSGAGQTNHLLGKIATREYVFHHALHGGSPLVGQALSDRIVEVAQALPGFQEFCGHQADLAERAQDWTRCVEKSHYFPYDSAKPLTTAAKATPEPSEPRLTWNEQQALQARDRILQGLQTLLDQGTLPAGVGARCRALEQFGISRNTLYREQNRSLWHPSELSSDSIPMPSEPVPPQAHNPEEPDRVKPAPEEVLQPEPANKLMAGSFDEVRGVFRRTEDILYLIRGICPRIGWSERSLELYVQDFYGVDSPSDLSLEDSLKLLDELEQMELGLL